MNRISFGKTNNNSNKRKGSAGSNSSSGSSNNKNTTTNEEDEDNNSVSCERTQCPYCDTSVSRRRDLKRHILIHIKGHGDYRCEFCGNPYTRLDSTLRHLRSCAKKPKKK
ncbi:hypothetical protein BDA99DRAFT_528955 [Phascolomyces articulosus]|uniref:C2H2-type domain-containing protein n=1 Tax=Phascolomyces articulosus TaxID=60185 RepID=A0AAD5P7C8_9FUNG|nr:hypothetical protein BDA99DRAFT_528955 [Phascolomyces articulosus]